MRFLCSVPLFAFLVAFSYCDITGLWFSDWQNNINFACLPYTFTIKEISPANYSVTYDFASINISQNTYCQQARITQGFSSFLTQDTTTGDWQDSLGQTYVYDDSIETIMMTSNSGRLNLFDRNGAYIPLLQGYGLVVGTWVNPTLANTSQAQYCCAPSNVTIIKTSSAEDYPSILMTSFYDPNVCPSPNPDYNSLFLEIDIPNIVSITWVEIASETSIYFSFNSSIGQDKLVLSYNASYRYNCTYYFDKFGTNLNGTWYSDWQNGGVDHQYVPYSFQIQTIDDTYMIINYNYSNSQTQDIIFEIIPNIYACGVINYTYLPDVNSLEYSNRLFTPTGNILDASEFIGVWENPQTTSGSSVSSCCVPQYINIYNQTSSSESSYSLQATFENFSSGLCPGISDGETYTDYLYTYNPNPYSIQWDSLMGFGISFPNTSITSEILVSSPDSWSQSCSFTMSRGSGPNSALLFSLGIQVLLILGLFLLIFN